MIEVITCIIVFALIVWFVTWVSKVNCRANEVLFDFQLKENEENEEKERYKKLYKEKND